MAQTEALKLVIEVDAATGEAKLKQFSGQVEDTGKKGTAAFKSMGASAIQLASALGVVVSAGAAFNFLKNSFVDFAKTERQWNAIAFQMRALGDATGKTAAATREMIDALSEQSGILDDDLIPAYQRLFLGTRNAAASQDLLTIAARFAANGIGDVQSNAERLATSIQSGTVSALKEFGVVTEDAAGNTISLRDGLTQVYARFNELNPTLNDAQSKIDSLSLKFDKLKDKTGSAANSVLNFLISYRAQITALATNPALLVASFAPGKADTSGPAPGGGSGHRDNTMLDSLLGLTPPQVEETKQKAAASLTAVYEDLYKRQAAIRTALAKPSSLVGQIAGADFANIAASQLAPTGGFAINTDVSAQVEAERGMQEALTAAYDTQTAAVNALNEAKLRLAEQGLNLTASQSEQEAATIAAAAAYEAQTRVIQTLTVTQQLLASVSQAAAISTGKSAKTAFEVNKAVNLALAIVNTARAIVEVLPNYYLAAAVAVTGALQIYKIISTKIGSSSAPTLGGGGGGGSNRGVGPAAGARVFNESGPVGGEEIRDRRNRKHSGKGMTVKVEAMDGASVERVIRSKRFQRALGRSFELEFQRG